MPKRRPAAAVSGVACADQGTVGGDLDGERCDDAHDLCWPLTTPCLGKHLGHTGHIDGRRGGEGMCSATSGSARRAR